MNLEHCKMVNKVTCITVKRYTWNYYKEKDFQYLKYPFHEMKKAQIIGRLSDVREVLVRQLAFHINNNDIIEKKT